MFLKPYRVKSNTAIKGSDRRKLRASVTQAYPISDEQVSELIPAKDPMTVMKLYTYAGETVHAYTVDNNPIFFELENVIYPTVYTLWKHPDLLPALTTWPSVFKNLSQGADLMLPGVILKNDIFEALGKRNKGAPVAISLKGNRAPVAVGRTLLSTEDMYMSAMRGKGVAVLHSYMDQLWSHGNKSTLPELAEQTQEFAVDESEGIEDAEEEERPEVAVEGQPANVNLPQIDTLEISEALEALASPVSNDGQAAEIGSEASATNAEESGMERMDALLLHCLCAALKTSGKKMELPCLTSAFYSAHMLPAVPPGARLDIKKSSYKKLSRFLQAMQREGLVSTKELTRGVDSLVAINHAHPRLRQFVVPPPQERVSATPEESKEVAGGPRVVEMFAVNAAVLPIFARQGYSKGAALAAADVREVVTEHVRRADGRQGALVAIDPSLADIVLPRGDATTHLRWDELMRRVQTKMQPAHQVALPGREPFVRKGKLQPIALALHQRSGNKKVTLVSNLESFGIDPAEFAHEVQVGVACSTSVGPLPGKGALAQVLVQGNQVRFIAALLADKYKVNPRYVTGLEHAPKKKRN
ncbi:PREDICTED: eukaryotic translation initiation factor 2D-like [Priapulus caudatus]|uniref:Eukaryotic translation initiation factor 2D-like n=1 Tax=Priapulus caudatus TaxID=37621 RepID=A0ABM1F0Z8_PRICU|nr:PREDICTED: eukaryotic translation initiation factor 2D-like [Priapulus caudatus]